MARSGMSGNTELVERQCRLLIRRRERHALHAHYIVRNRYACVEAVPWQQRRNNLAKTGGGGIGLVYWHLFRKYGGLSMNRATAG